MKSYYYKSHNEMELICDRCKKIFKSDIISMPISEEYFCSPECLWREVK